MRDRAREQEGERKRGGTVSPHPLIQPTLSLSSSLIATSCNAEIADPSFSRNHPHAEIRCLMITHPYLKSNRLYRISTNISPSRYFNTCCCYYSGSEQQCGAHLICDKPVEISTRGGEEYCNRGAVWVRYEAQGKENGGALSLYVVGPAALSEY